MNLSNTVRELFTENPMTTEGTRTLRRMLRVGGESENPYASKILYRFLFYTLAVLYFWMVTAILSTEEDLSIYLLMGELGLLTLLVPGSLYGAIAVEREKQTYESLILTRLSPAQIVAGKLIWRVVLIGGLMALFLPLLIATHIMGAHHYNDRAMTWGQLAWSQVVIFAWSVCIGAFALWVSAKSKKGITAMLGVVAGLIAFLAIVPALAAMFGVFNHEVSRTNPMEISSYSYDEDGSRIFSTRNGLYARFAFSNLATSVVVALNPVGLLLVSPQDTDHYVTLYQYWTSTGIYYWSVAVYAGFAALFVRAATKTLRGLELPVAEKTRRA
ncbi:MAG: ABC transporter permease subunit, partial [Armatimonadetes bacterium]|nr:ABC transporter permease subunit [Armatimonadota bacterium]